MPTRVLVLDAGTGASNSLVRSLKAADPSIRVVGCHDDRFVLKQSCADRRYLIPASTQPGFPDALRRVVGTERVDLVMPNSDAHVTVVARLRHELPCRVFLPTDSVIELCQDKYRLTAFLRERGIAVPATYPVSDLDGIGALFRRLARHQRLWCRIRTGAGSAAAIPVRRPEHVRSWIRYWQEMRGVPATAFILSEYLPGRDFACQSVWRDGRLILIKTCERLSYFWGTSRPSGVSGIAALAKTVVEPRVVAVCQRAIRALGADVSGAFSIDLKEDASGVPRITEINAGRFITMLNLFDFAGSHNMSLTYVRAGLGEALDLREAYDAVEDYYFVRDVDTVPGVFHADDLFTGIEDARSRRAIGTRS